MRAFSQEAALSDSLPRGVSVRLARVDGEPSALDLSVLTESERARARKYVFVTDRARFVTTRALLRRALGQALRVAPEHVPIAVGDGGRPYLDGAPAGELDFNVSHSGGMAAIALSEGRRVGIDVEIHRRDRKLRALVPDVMGTSEREMLDALEDDAFYGAFYGCWTRKEAIAKALGSGLAYSLTALDVPHGGVVRVMDAARARAFSVRTTVLASGFTLSLAAEAMGTGDSAWP